MVVIIMGNMIVFKALSSETRIEIIKLLLTEEHHITGLARKIGISVPVMSRHVDILSDAGLVKKRIIGNVHLLSVNLNVFEHALDDFCDHTELHIVQNQSLFEALKQLPEIKFTKYKDKQFISSINGGRATVNLVIPILVSSPIKRFISSIPSFVNSRFPMQKPLIV